MIKRLLLVGLLCSTPAWGAISFVGEVGQSIASGAGNTAVTLPTVLEDDIVIVVTGCDFGQDIEGPSTTGYIFIDHGTQTNPGISVSYKIMGVTPDTTVDIIHESARETCVTVQAFRGVDTTTPLDGVTPTNTTGTSADPDPLTITTATDNAWVVVASATDDDSPSTITSAPSGYSNAILQDTDNEATGQGASCHMASKLVVTAASEDPGAWVISGADDEWNAWTIVLRPAGAPAGRTRRMF